MAKCLIHRYEKHELFCVALVPTHFLVCFVLIYCSQRNVANTCILITISKKKISFQKHTPQWKFLNRFSSFSGKLQRITEREREREIL